MFRKKETSIPVIDPSVLPQDIVILKEQRRLLRAASEHEAITQSMKSQRRIAEGRLALRWALFCLLLVSLGNFFYIYHVDFRSAERAKPHIGIVDIFGPISADHSASADRVLNGIHQAMKQEGSIKALVIRINSPGGSPVEAQRIYHEIRRQRELHPSIPIYSWIGDVGASGAYYVAAATQEIGASPSALVGSIGVISSGFGFNDLLTRVGVERRAYTAGDNKSFLDPFAPVLSEQAGAWQLVLDDVHEQFIADVKQGRNGELDAYEQGDEVFSGMVWSGQQAKSLGLIDNTLQLDEALRGILPQEDGGTPPIVNYTTGLSTLDRLAKTLTTSLLSVLASNGLPSVQFEGTL